MKNPSMRELFEMMEQLEDMENKDIKKISVLDAIDYLKEVFEKIQNDENPERHNIFIANVIHDGIDDLYNQIKMMQSIEKHFNKIKTEEK